jgi:hypothetical protein
MCYTFTTLTNHFQICYPALKTFEFFNQPVTYQVEITSQMRYKNPHNLYVKSCYVFLAYHGITQGSAYSSSNTASNYDVLFVDMTGYHS